MSTIPSIGSGAPTPQELADPAHARAWKAAQDFEAMALGQFMRPMFDTVDAAKGLFGGGNAEAQWRPMLTDELARGVARHGGLGLAAPVYRQLLRNQEDHQTPGPP